MKCITGDLHGGTDIWKVGSTAWPFGQRLTKSDYLFVAGDSGLWFSDTPNERGIRTWLNEQPWTTLIVDGNHENFDLMETYPDETMFGGKVKVMDSSTFWLRRGEVYEIDYSKIFVFGGADSIDKDQRMPGRSWWPQEIPTRAEFENAERNLTLHNWEVDFVISHTCPHAEVESFVKPGYGVSWKRFEDPTTYMLQELKDKLKFRKWYFGHFHKDKEIGRFHALYNTIAQMY